MNDFQIGLIASLDGTKSKQQLNQDIEALKKQLGNIEIQAKLGKDVINNLTKQLNATQFNLQNVFIDQNTINKMVSQINTALSGININLGNALNNGTGQIAQNTGRQIGQQIQNGINQSLLRDKSKIKFEESFKQSNNAAKEAQKYFQELDILKKEGATVTVSEKYDNSELKSFIVNVKRATGEVESLNYQLRNLGDNDNIDMWFQFTGGRSNDIGAISQLEEISKYYTEYATKLNDLKTKYSNTNLDVSGFETTLNNFKKGIGTVNDLKIAFNDLENSAKLSVQSLKSQTASFDPIQQTLNNMRDIPSMLKKLAASMDNVKDKTKIADISVSDLQKNYDVLKTEMDNNNGNVPLTQSWIEQYKILMSTIISTIKQVEALKKAEASDNSSTTKQANYYSSILSNYREMYKLKQKLLTADREESAEINGRIQSLNSSNAAIYKQLKSQGLSDSSWQSQVNRLKAQLTYNLQIAEAHQKDKVNQENINSSQKESLQITKDLARAYQKVQDIKIKIASLDKDADSNTRSALSNDLANAKDSYNKLYKNLSRRKNYDQEEWKKTKKAIDEATESKSKYNTSKAQDNLEKQINTQLGNLNSLKDKWKEQGILVNEFEKKVNDLENRLSSVGTKGELNKLKKELRELKVEASFLTSEKQINTQFGNGTFLTQIEVLKNKFQQIGLSSDEADKKVEKLYELLNRIKTSSGKELANNYKEFNNVLTITRNELSVLMAEQSKFVSETSRLAKAGSWQKWIDNNTKATKKYGKEINDLIEKMKNLDEVLLKSDADKMSVHMQKLQSNARNDGLLGMSTTDKLKNAWGKFGGWSIATGSLMATVSKVKDAISEINDVDDILTEISKTSELTAQQLKTLGMTSYDTASQYGNKASDYLTGIQEMYRAGFDNASEMSELSILAQAAGDMTAGMSNDYLIATNAAYNLKGNIKDLNDVLDGQNYITNNAAVSMSDMAAATSEAASIASQYGVKIEELSSLIAVATAKTRESGSETGNALKSLFINLQDTTSKPIREAFEAVGISMTKIVDGSEKLKTPIELLKELSQAFNSLPEGDTRRANILSDIGGKYHANTLLNNPG